MATTSYVALAWPASAPDKPSAPDLKGLDHCSLWRRITADVLPQS